MQQTMGLCRQIGGVARNTTGRAWCMPAPLLRALGLGLVFVASGWLDVSARAAEVTWQVSVGFANAAKQGAWTPIFVDVRNEGESQTGRIVVPVRMSTFGYTPRYTDYVLPVELPRHARKRYTLYIPLVEPGGPERAVLDLSRYREEKRNPAGPNIKSARQGDLLIVVVGGEAGFMNFLSGKRGLGITLTRDTSQSPRYGPQGFGATESEAQVGRVEWTGLPDSWIGWDGVDAVVLGDAAFSGLSPEAQEALRAWVRLGGTLVVPGGTLAPSVASSPIADLLPADISGTTTLPDLSVLAAWSGAAVEQQPVLIAQLSLRPGAQVLCGTVSQPLIVSRRAGSGRVIMTAFDFTASPLKYWDGQEAMWANLLIGAVHPPSRVGAKETVDPWMEPFRGLTGAASTMPEAELPSMGLIVGFLLAYIVVLVPLNYSLLNRFDRRELAWITTPAIVLIFTFGAYGLGYAMRGGTIVFNRLGVVEAAAGSPIGRGHGYLGLFSPARTSYDINLDKPASGARDLAQAEQRLGGRLAIVAGAEQRIVNAAMNMWTTRAFGVEYTVDLQKGIWGVLEYDGKTITGRVHNGTTLPLENGRIVVGERAGKAVNISAGTDESVTYSAKTARQVASNPYFGNPRGNSPPSLEELGLAALFTAGNPGMYPPGFGGSTAMTSSAPVFVATTQDLHTPATLARRNPQVKDATILLVDLPIRLARGQTISVPRWLVSSRIIGAQGNFSYNPYGGGFEIVQGSVTTEFALPAEGRPCAASKIDLTVSSVNTGSPIGAVKVAAYDFTRHEWETLVQPPPGTATPGGGAAAGMGMRGGGMGGGGGLQTMPIAFPHPQDFMAPDGSVRVKVAAPAGAVRVDDLNLTATVKVS